MVASVRRSTLWASTNRSSSSASSVLGVDVSDMDRVGRWAEAEVSRDRQVRVRGREAVKPAVKAGRHGDSSSRPMRIVKLEGLTS